MDLDISYILQRYATFHDAGLQPPEFRKPGCHHKVLVGSLDLSPLLGLLLSQLSDFYISPEKG
jgi:hypothetical protein